MEKTIEEAYREEFYRPNDKFIVYQEILIKQKDEIKEKLQKGKIDAQLKEKQKKLRKMKDDLKRLTLKGELEVFQSDLIEKTNNLLN